MRDLVASSGEFEDCNQRNVSLFTLPSNTVEAQTVENMKEICGIPSQFVTFY